MKVKIYYIVDLIIIFKAESMRSLIFYAYYIKFCYHDIVNMCKSSYVLSNYPSTFSPLMNDSETSLPQLLYLFIYLFIYSYLFIYLFSV